MATRKNLDAFYKKALKKILSFKASELSTVEFEQVKRNAGIVKEIRLAEDDDSIQERDVIYIKMEKNGIILELSTSQPGLRIIWSDENVEV